MNAATAYHVTNRITPPVTLTVEEALADWEAAEPDLREGNPDSGFVIWIRGTDAPRLAPTFYRPIPEEPARG